MTRRFLCVLPVLALLGAPAIVLAKTHPVPTPKPQTNCARVQVPRRGTKKAHTILKCEVRAPEPQQQAVATPEPTADLSHALPAKEVLKGPSTKEQFNALRNQIIHDRPAVTEAKQKSDTLKAQAVELQRKLIATAARVVDLETEKLQLDADITHQTAENETLSASFARGRGAGAGRRAGRGGRRRGGPPAGARRPGGARGAAR